MENIPGPLDTLLNRVEFALWDIVADPGADTRARPTEHVLHFLFKLTRDIYTFMLRKDY